MLGSPRKIARLDPNSINLPEFDFEQFTPEIRDQSRAQALSANYYVTIKRKNTLLTID